ncbi:tetratricopeptide repeat protein [Prevotella falsenii]|uniref:tetratricopeptide repeat protein n=1 Tax=Prevotella falsenii TaxID=515414 RepID=UPI000AC796D9|nr:tetratricopeptide repeat protein [Prevotella falsenii]
MNKPFLILLLFTVILCGCRRTPSETSNRLSEIDSLIRHNQLDSAFRIIDMVDAGNLTSSADSAAFFLQKTQLLYKLYKPIESTDMIDYSIKYYENRKGNVEQLADAYFYKGAIVYDQGQVKDAIVCMKKAEYTAEKLASDNIKLKIYENLFIMNEEAGERQLALGYAKKVLRLATAAKDKIQLARAYNNIAVAYNKLNKADSANIYIKKSMEMLHYIPRKEQIYILNNIGAQLIATNRKRQRQRC